MKDNSPQDDAVYWPGAEAVAVENVQGVTCSMCGINWIVHRDLSGFRIRCRCSAMIVVPMASDNSVTVPLKPNPPLRRGRVSRQGSVFETDDEEPSSANTNRGIFELILILLALMLPHVVLLLWFQDNAQALAFPAASVVGGLLVLALGFFTPRHAFSGLVPAKFRYYLFALCFAIASAFAAILYGDALGIKEFSIEVILRRENGLIIALFSLAVCPAVFEEIGFRGMLQGRLCENHGTRLGLTLTATAFALAHGVTIGLPFHFGLGLLLCWLRNRCGSLFPGMVLHALYNGILVTLL